ncbi:protein lethal(2)denticleless isoform X2 [Anthonomus grandis grandis]|nr:protein lethal(2)denticleless isoform X2 [Anthonomus grandis grandis]
MANEDGRLVVMDYKTNEKHIVNAHNNAIFDLAWKFDQMQIVTASGDHTCKLYDFGDGDFREVRMFCGHTRSVKTVNFRKDDSSVFASGSRDGNIILWDTRTDLNSFIGKADCTIMNSHAGKDVNTPSKNKKKYNAMMASSGIKSVTSLVFQNENSLISCGAGDGMIKIWDLRRHYTVNKKEPLPKYTIPYTGKTAKNGFSNLIIDSAGLKLYANCMDNTIYCYNVGTYDTEPVMSYVGHQNSTFYVKSALSKDERYLVSGSTDEHAYIWNLKYSKPIVKLVGHAAEVTCVTWCNSELSPVLFTCSDDLTYKVWSVCGLDCSDHIRGKAGILPMPIPPKPTRKRILLPLKPPSPYKKILKQCENCQNPTESPLFCENCFANRNKRKAETELWSENKKITTEFGPRRLFAQISRNFREIVDNGAGSFAVLERPTEDVDRMSLKSLNKALESFKTSNEPQNHPPTSPTLNLPNFNVDGTAPHLNYSPPKRKSQDWLTRMRVERHLRQQMLEQSYGPTTPPKQPKIEPGGAGFAPVTPRSSRKAWPNAGQSPLLRFFKVRNSSGGKCGSGIGGGNAASGEQASQ